MEISDQILKAREERSYLINKYLESYQIVSIHSNIVGMNKNIKEAYFLLNHFGKVLDSFKPIKKEVHESMDGPYMLYFFNLDFSLKEKCIKIEEDDEIGRLIDLDVFYKTASSENRNSFRKCMICSSPAFYCIREKRHSEIEILNFIKEKVKTYIDSLIITLASNAIDSELNLSPKFGLVCKNGRSSHKDMNYSLMLKAKDSIKEGFADFFDNAFLEDNLEKVKENMRKIGIRMENDMLSKTGGVNAYKGLIFNLGILITSFALKVKNLNEGSIFEISKSLCKGITNELKHGSDSFGKIAFQKYKLTGARGEAESGFLDVYNVYKKYNLKDDLIDALIYLIINISDTTLLKRAGSIDKYFKVKEDFKNILDLDYLNKKCIEDGLSFGGAADLLICAIFLKDLSEYFDLGV